MLQWTLGYMYPFKTCFSIRVAGKSCSDGVEKKIKWSEEIVHAVIWKEKYFYKNIKKPQAKSRFECSVFQQGDQCDWGRASHGESGHNESGEVNRTWIITSLRTLGFTLSVTRNYWSILKCGLIWSDLYYTSCMFAIPWKEVEILWIVGKISVNIRK